MVLWLNLSVESSKFFCCKTAIQPAVKIKWRQWKRIQLNDPISPEFGHCFYRKVKNIKEDLNRLWTEEIFKMEKKSKNFMSLSQGEILGFEDEIRRVNVTKLKKYFYYLIGNYCYEVSVIISWKQATNV